MARIQAEMDEAFGGTRRGRMMLRISRWYARQGKARGGTVRRVSRPWAGDNQDCGGTPPARIPDRTRIALLEHELFGIEPEPGTAAAAMLGARRLGELIRQAAATPVDRAACPHEHVVDTTEFAQARRRGVCQRCGAPVVEDDDGRWRFP